MYIFGLDMASGVAVSPDGTYVYVGAADSDAVAVFSRNTSTGVRTQLGIRACQSDSGTGGACTDVRALDGVHRITVSPNGRHVYASGSSGTSTGYIAVFTGAGW